MTVSNQDKHGLVRGRYGEIAASYSRGEEKYLDMDERMALGERLGYSVPDLTAHPGANLGLGCGNPLVLAQIRPGDQVADLGSGAGFDALLAAQRVGSTGRVIGVDMTDEMLALASKKAEEANLSHIVEFRKGDIQNLPLDDSSMDILMSNCVINLAPDKQRVFSEAYRVLRPGGWLSLSDIVLNMRLPRFILRSAGAYVGCLAGAIPKQEYLDIVRAAGFQDISIAAEVDALSLVPTELIEKLKAQFQATGVDLTRIPSGAAVSIHLKATKPVA